MLYVYFNGSVIVKGWIICVVDDVVEGILCRIEEVGGEGVGYIIVFLICYIV